MKKFGSILLTLAVLFTLCAGALPVYGASTLTFSANRTVLVPGQYAVLTITPNPSSMTVEISITDDDPYHDVVSYDSHSKNVTALRKGTAVVTATATNPSTNETITKTITIKVRTPTGLLNNTDYYIMNCGTEKLLSLASTSDANSVSIVGTARSDAMISRWTLSIATDADGNYAGRTELISANSAAGRKAYVSGTNLILYNTSGERTKFALHRIESGTNQGKYAIRYGTQYVAMNSSGTVYLTSSSSDNIYWCFMAVEKNYADLYSHNYSYTKDGETKQYNTTVNNTEFTNVLSSAGYSPYVFVNETPLQAYEYLPDDDVFVFRGHGNAGIISFRTTGDAVTGVIAVHRNVLGLYGDTGTIQHFINSFEYNELASLRCALFIGCNTGLDITIYRKTYNLLNATFEKGAHFVVGTTQTIYSDDANDFLAGFLGALKNKANLYNCYRSGLINASPNPDYVTEDHPSSDFPAVYVGDGSQYLN